MQIMYSLGMVFLTVLGMVALIILWAGSYVIIGSCGLLKCPECKQRALHYDLLSRHCDSCGFDGGE